MCHVMMGGAYLCQVVSQTATNDVRSVEPQECGHCLRIAVCTNAK